VDWFPDWTRPRLTLATLDPPFWHKLLWLGEIPFLIADDQVLEDHLNLQNKYYETFYLKNKNTY